MALTLPHLNHYLLLLLLSLLMSLISEFSHTAFPPTSLPLFFSLSSVRRHIVCGGGSYFAFAPVPSRLRPDILDMRWEKEVYLDSVKESKCFLVWGCKVSMMDLQWEIFLKVHALKREWDKKRISFKERSSLQLLRQGRILTAKIKKKRERKIGLHIHPLKIIKNWRVN